MEVLELKQTVKQLDAADFSLERSRFIMGSLQHSYFENITMAGTTIFNANLSGVKIVDANLSDLEIEGAQLGGAYIHNIGMPPKGHPMYVEGARMRPVKFEDCALS